MCVEIVINIYIKQSMLVLLYIFYTSGDNLNKENGVIYILEWTSAAKEPFNYLGIGQYPFVSRNCSFQNCYLTDNREHFESILDFDVLMFNAVNLHLEKTFILPQTRSEAQEYILVGLEPSAYYHIPSIYNGYFNMTWTYKLGSDVPYPYVIVKNIHGKVIGPRKEMRWIHFDDMAPTEYEIIRKVWNKTIAAAWIASNCAATSGRLNYAHSLNIELNKYGHRVDIYGNCGNMVCPQGNGMVECYAKIESDYYFYLAFENSFGEDYVTEKLLHALEHYAVPIVLGGANYTRFMPDGMYLNAMNYGVEQLAKEINEIIRNPQRYFDFFKWINYYSFHTSEEDDYYDAVCGMCALLNNRTRKNLSTVYDHITKWWNEPKAHKGDEPIIMNFVTEEDKTKIPNEQFYCSGFGTTEFLLVYSEAIFVKNTIDACPPSTFYPLTQEIYKRSNYFL